MLESLNIENIAVIEKASLEFSDGLNLLTGETGAGKSIIIDSINAVLGERTTRDLVRNGAQNGLVSAFFSNVPQVVDAKMKEFDLPVEEDRSMLITRRIAADGKNSCKINGRTVTASILKEIGRLLINIHGQHDSQSLLDPEQHYKFIDMLMQNKSAYSDYLSSFRSLIELRRQLKALSIDEAEKEKKLDLLRYQINEIEAADIKPGEKETLIKRREMIANSESIVAALHSALLYMDGSDEQPGVQSALGSMCGAVETASRYHPDLAQMATALYDTLYELEGHKDKIRSVLEQVEFDPKEQEAIEERLDLLHRFSVKYGGTEELILSFATTAKQQLDAIQSADEELARLTELYQLRLKETMALAEALSAERKKTAAVFEQNVKKELSFLDMPHVQFSVYFERGKLNHLGFDQISFLISTNPGEPLKGLNKIASGGELSRIMLAMKNIIAQGDSIGTLIFDEIDTGVSGSASRKIGEKLKSVSKNCQVLCVTHSAQIASFADRHLYISKEIKEDRTYTGVQILNFEERVKELARIMAGSSASESMLNSAREMLNNNLEDK